MTRSIARKVAGIILAAGSSSRMGKTKQLLPIDNTTLLGRLVKQALDSKLESISIVLGHNVHRIKKSLAAEFGKNLPRIVLNPDYADGQSTSLIKGIKDLPEKTDGAMFLLADQPMITTSIINRVIEVFSATESLAAIPCHKGKRGNPVIVSKMLFPELLCLQGDTGARALFQKYKDRILMADGFTPAVLIDIDTPLDYKLYRETGFSRYPR